MPRRKPKRAKYKNTRSSTSIINPRIPITGKKVSSTDDVLISCERMGMISCPDGGCAMHINQCGEPKVRRQGGRTRPRKYQGGGQTGNNCPVGTHRAADGTCRSIGS